MAKSIILNLDSKKTRKWPKYVVIGAVVVVVLLVVIMAFWALIPQKYDRVTITNEDILKDVSRRDMNDLKKRLVDLLIDKELIAEDATLDDVVIREESVVDYTTYDAKKNKAKVTTFLIDIESVKQTYRVSMHSASTELTDLPIQITCPMASETKYPDSVCEAAYESSSRSVRNNLPHELKLSSGEKVYVKTIESTMGGSQLLQIYLYSCDEKNPPIEETKQLVYDWVEELGDSSLDFYTYNVRPGYCEGDTI